jgi:Na+-driven multidrug efflux pump
MAASVLVGQNLGAGRADRACKIGWEIALSGVVILSVLAAVIFVWAEAFAALLSKDTLVLRETTRYLRITMFSEPFMALSLTLAGALQGAGDTKGTMQVIIFGMWLIRLPLAFLLALVFDFGAQGVWVAMLISMIFQGVLMSWRFYRGRWKNISLDQP